MTLTKGPAMSLKETLGAAVLAVSVAACVTTPPRDIAAARQDLDVEGKPLIA